MSGEVDSAIDGSEVACELSCAIFRKFTVENEDVLTRECLDVSTRQYTDKVLIRGQSTTLGALIA